MHQFSTLIELLRYQQEHLSDEVAYKFVQNSEIELDSVSYQELDQQARKIAAYLQSILKPSDRALLLYQPGLEFIAAFFGCLYAEIIAVPAYPPRHNQNSSRLKSIIEDAQAKAVLTTTFLQDSINSRLSKHLDVGSIYWLTTDNIANELATDWKEPQIDGNTLAFLQYTSGSTGTPKGVMVSHHNLLHNEQMIEKAFGHTEKTVVVGWLPFYHDMGLIGNILQPLYLGRPSILMSPVAFLQEPFFWLQTISRYKATTSGGPNFAYEWCIQKITPQQQSCLDLSSWEVAFTGAEFIRAETIEQFARRFKSCGFRQEAFYPCYGLAETTLFATGGLKTAPPVVLPIERTALEKNQVVVAAKSNNPHKIVGCGQAWLDEKIVIADPETLTQCYPNTVGEIWVSSSSVAQGYWNQREQTEQTFHAYLADTGEGPFLRTGDLGFLQNGELFVTGRIKEMIIIRGQNHYPQDIEITVENSHTALRAGFGAAFAVEINSEERLVIVYEVERSYLRKLNVGQVVEAIRQAVSEQHEIQVYAVVLLKTASIPKTSSGKIQRYACRSKFLAGNLEIIADWAENPANKAAFITLELETKLNLLTQQLQRLKQQPSLIVTHSDDKNNGSLQQKNNSPQKIIEAWLILQLSMYLKIAPTDIDTKENLAQYGLDSAVAVSLTGELGKWLNCELEPTLFWEYPSIDSIAQYLAQEFYDLALFPLKSHGCIAQEV